MNDLIRLAMERACALFGGSDGVFSNAAFSKAFARLAGVQGPIDGMIVRAMLTGRTDVRVLRFDHFQLVAITDEKGSP